MEIGSIQEIAPQRKIQSMRVYADDRRITTPEEEEEEEMMPTTTTASSSSSSRCNNTNYHSKVEDVGRLPSIELEPKTLTLDQIKYAREAALYVVSTKSEEEAIRIFTAGLKPVNQQLNNVRTTSKSAAGSSMDSSDDDVDLGGSNTGGGRCGKGGGCCRRGLRRASSSSSVTVGVRDVATAPF